MIETGLRISDDLEPLPIEQVVATQAILANKGAGKTHTGSVFAEEMIGLGQKVVIVDPTDAWWGLRADVDGNPNGLPVVIFGGRRGDLPLDEHAGAAIADAVVDGSFSCILSLRHFETEASQVRFLLAFVKRLHYRNRDPVHVFLDEAESYIPQQVTGDYARLVGAFSKIVKQGRIDGIGITMISQRAAALNKNVLTQIETMIALRTTAPQDCDAVSDWLRVKPSALDLPSLGRGQALLWSPHGLGITEPRRIHIRQRRTFNSSATPKVGEKRIEPRALAPVDLEAIRALLPEPEPPAEQPKSTKDLRHRIAELEQLVRLHEDELARRAEPQFLPAIPQSTRRELEAVHEDLGKIRERVSRAIDSVPVLDAPMQAIQVRPRPAPADEGPIEIDPDAPREAVGVPRKNAPPPPAPRSSATDSDRLDATPRRMLAALASFHPRALTRAQLAALVGISSTTGSFRTYISALSTRALIEKSGDLVSLTRAGVKTAGHVKQPATTAELVAMWSEKLDAAPRKILRIVVADYPKWIQREAIASELGISESTGSFRTYISALHTVGLIEKQGPSAIRASSSLFLRGGAGG